MSQPHSDKYGTVGRQDLDPIPSAMITVATSGKYYSGRPERPFRLATPRSIRLLRLVSGSHLTPTLWTPLRRLLFPIVVFRLFDLAIVYRILDRLSSPLRRVTEDSVGDNTGSLVG